MKPTSSPKQKLSLSLPEDVVKRVKIEVIERGKGVTEASIALEALECYWAFEAKKGLIPKLREQVQAKVPPHMLDFGVGKLPLELKLYLLDLVVRGQTEG